MADGRYRGSRNAAAKFTDIETPGSGQDRRSRHTMPILHIVDGKLIEKYDRGPLARQRRFLLAPFASTWHHRDLIGAILRRELHDRFKGSVAGWVWAIVTPLLSLVTYTLIFRGAIKLPGGTASGTQVDYALFIFGGLVAFNLFTEMAYRAPSLMHEYSHYIKQTMFPAEMLPVISTLRATFYASISLALMLVAQLLLSGTLYWTVLAVPLWLIPFVVFLIGITWLLSATGAYSRDTYYLMMTIAPWLMFVTPVFFSRSALSPNMQMLMYVNPLTGYIEILRSLVVFGELPSLAVCAWTVFLAFLAFWFGFWFFNRHRPSIADVI
jgi:lipopolysaccharide transport system permease protein